MKAPLSTKDGSVARRRRRPTMRRAKCADSRRARLPRLLMGKTSSKMRCGVAVTREACRTRLLRSHLPVERALASPFRAFVGPASSRLHQRRARLRRRRRIVARLAHRLQHVGGRGRRVEADAVGDAAVLVRIVREHDRDALLGIRLARKPRPARGQLGDESDAVRLRLVADRPAFGERIELARLLERDGAAR